MAAKPTLALRLGGTRPTYCFAGGRSHGRLSVVAQTASASVSPILKVITQLTINGHGVLMINV